MLEKYAALAGVGQWNNNALSKGAVRVRNAVLGCVKTAHCWSIYRAPSASCVDGNSQKVWKRQAAFRIN